MKFKINKFENKILGNSIIIKEIKNNDFNKIFKLIEQIGFRRNKKIEKEIKDFANKNNLENKKEIYLNYSNKDNDLEISYDTKWEICRIGINSNKINAKEFVELLKNNCDNPSYDKSK